MRFLAAVLALALLASPAHAQNMGGMGGGGTGGKGGGKGRNSPQNTEQQKADQQKKKAADDAYKAGLQRIPASVARNVHVDACRIDPAEPVSSVGRSRC
jgi:hypothetical protein